MATRWQRGMYGVMVAAVAVLCPAGMVPAGEARAQGGFPIPSILRSIHGQVVSSTTGLPITGNTVRLTGNDVSLVTMTDSEGLFQFDGLMPWTYLVMATGGVPTLVTVSGFDAYVTLEVRP